MWRGTHWQFREFQSRSRTLQFRRFAMLALAIILLVLWALGFFAFHIAGGLIHILLGVALVVFVVNLVRGRSAI